MSHYQTALRRHYERVWEAKSDINRWTKGPVHELHEDFCIFEFPPVPPINAWAYATCRMSDEGDFDSPQHEELLELHLWSPIKSVYSSGEGNHFELLTAIAHYHRTGAKLGLGHSVNFGRTWLPNSNCTHGLISLPYLHGPELENHRFEDVSVRCLWLVPITQDEVEFKRKHGLDALEQLFEESEFNYLDYPSRESVIILRKD